jgi:HAD superfamily hydrolase (TIGR01509 family)
VTAIIFDVDGTLAETEELHRRSFNKAFAEMEVDRMWPDVHSGWRWSKEVYGRLLKTTGGKERISAYLRDELSLDPADLQPTVAEIHAAKTRWFARLLANGDMAPRAGVERIIAMARSTGVGLAIATTTSRPNVDALCRALFGQAPEDIFQVVSTGEDVSCKKPAPDVYLLTLARLNMPAEACVALEDSRNGMIAATTARLRCVVSPSLYMRDENFDGSDALVGDFTWEVIEEMLFDGVRRPRQGP